MQTVGQPVLLKGGAVCVCVGGAGGWVSLGVLGMVQVWLLCSHASMYICLSQSKALKPNR